MSRNDNDIDERARRTRNALARALIELSADRELDAITVGELVRAAGVGRSTFYAHFTSWTHFLQVSYASMLERSVLSAQQVEPANVLPTRLLFEHMARSREYGAKVRQSRAWPSMIAAGRSRLTRLTERSLRARYPELDAEQAHWAAACVAGALMGLVEEWTETGRKAAVSALERAFSSYLDGMLLTIGQTQTDATRALSTAKRGS